MNDIRANIHEMIATVRDERIKLEERLAVLKEREATLISWMKEEGPKQVILPMKESRGRSVSPLSAFLRSVLSDGALFTTEELARRAKEQNLIDEGKSAIRVVNFAMQSLKRVGIARTVKNRWAAADTK